MKWGLVQTSKSHQCETRGSQGTGAHHAFTPGAGLIHPAAVLLTVPDGLPLIPLVKTQTQLPGAMNSNPSNAWDGNTNFLQPTGPGDPGWAKTNDFEAEQCMV